MNVDMDLLAKQKALLVRYLWDVPEDDERFILWGIVEMIDYMQDSGACI